MATWTPPASFEQLVSDYDYFIEATIYRISLGRVRSQDVPDIKQAIYLRLWETGYLERYNPVKGSVSNYLYVLIRSVMSNIFDKNTRNALNWAIGTQERPSRLTPRDGRNRLVLEHHPRYTDHDFEARLVQKDAIDRVRAYAATQANSARLLQELDLFAQGYEFTEVARRVGKCTSVIMQDRQQLGAFLARAS